MFSTRLLLVGCAVSLLTPGCSHATPDDNDATGTPIAERIGFDPLLPGADTTGYATKLRQCMAEHGFEWYDEPASNGAPDPSTEGFGIADQYLGESPTQAPTPNDEYVASLSPTEQTQYQLALVGPLRASDADVPYAQLGCIPRLQIELYGGDAQVPKPLETLLDDVTSRANSDPSYLNVLHKWQQCMEESGFETDTHDELVGSFQSRIDAHAQSSNGTTVLISSNETTNALRAMKREEIAAATADADCTLRTRITEAYHDALMSAEAAAVDEHPELLDRSAWPTPPTHP